MEDAPLAQTWSASSGALSMQEVDGAVEPGLNTASSGGGRHDETKEHDRKDIKGENDGINEGDTQTGTSGLDESAQDTRQESEPTSPRMTPRHSISQGTPRCGLDGPTEGTHEDGVDTQHQDQKELKELLLACSTVEEVKKVMTMCGDRVKDDDDLKKAVACLSALFEQDEFTLPAPPMPTEPLFNPAIAMSSRVRKIQNFLRSFEYNHCGREFTATEKEKPSSHTLENARLIIKTGLPIKCLEAVVLGVYLTRDFTDLLRVPLRFKTKVNGHTYWHIVLVLRYNNKFGCLGLSRRSSLDYRELKFESFSELVLSYKAAYEEVGHTVKKMTVGLPFTRERTSERVFWHFLFLSVYKKADWAAALAVMNSYMKSIAAINEMVKQSGTCKELSGTEYRPDQWQLHFLPPSRQAKANLEHIPKGFGARSGKKDRVSVQGLHITSPSKKASGLKGADGKTAHGTKAENLARATLGV